MSKRFLLLTIFKSRKTCDQSSTINEHNMITSTYDSLQYILAKSLAREGLFLFKISRRCFLKIYFAMGSFWYVCDLHHCPDLIDLVTGLPCITIFKIFFTSYLFRIHVNIIHNSSSRDPLLIIIIIWSALVIFSYRFSEINGNWRGFL